MNTQEEQIKLSRKTVIEMLTDRGYETNQLLSVLPEPLFNQLWAKFSNESNVFDIECENNVGKRIYVKYIKNHMIDGKIKGQIIKKPMKFNSKPKYFHKKIKEMNDLLFDDSIIYVICDTDNTDIMDTYEDFLQKNKNVELFDIKRLLFNVSKHVLVPKHVKITDIREINKLKHNLAIDTIYKLPVISHTDPVARYFNLKRGDVVKIIRDSRSHGVYTSYRVCSDVEE